jgi:hypothetical protein
VQRAASSAAEKGGCLAGTKVESWADCLADQMAAMMAAWKDALKAGQRAAARVVS